MNQLRNWWVFRLPNSHAFVPASNEIEARKVLKRDSYKYAPIESWRLIHWRIATREEIIELLNTRSYLFND